MDARLRWLLVVVLFLTAVCGAYAVDFTGGLVSFIPMNDTTPGLAVDVVGGNNLTGNANNSSVDGNATYQFVLTPGGSNDVYLESELLSMEMPFTMGFWLYANRTEGVMADEDYYGTTPGWEFYSNSLCVHNADWVDYACNDYTGTFPGGQPMGGYVVVVFTNETNNSMFLYVNGSLIVPDTIDVTGNHVDSVVNSGIPFRMPANASATPDFVFDVRNLAVWDVALSAGNVSGLYAQDGNPLPLQQQTEFNVTECMNITQPGTYTMQNNINSTLDPNYCIFMLNPVNVTLDCRGFKLEDATPGATYDGISIQGNVSNVTIENCVVVNFTNGIEVYQVGSSDDLGALVMRNNSVVSDQNGYGVYADALVGTQSVSPVVEENGVRSFYAGAVPSDGVVRIDTPAGAIVRNNDVVTDGWGGMYIGAGAGEVYGNNVTVFGASPAVLAFADFSMWGNRLNASALFFIDCGATVILNNTLMGNAYMNSSGDAFSQTCVNDGFGICTLPYLDVFPGCLASDDFLPIALTSPPSGGQPVDQGGFAGGSSTNFSAVDTANVSYPVIESVGNVLIQWNGVNLNFSGANLSAFVTYGANWVDVQSANLPAGVNSSANVTLYGSYGLPVIYADGVVCGSCVLMSNNGSEAVFSVPHFTNYSVVNGSLYPLTYVNAKDNSTIANFCAGDNVSSYCTTNGTVYIDIVNASQDFVVKDATGSYYNVTAIFRQDGFEDNGTLMGWRWGVTGGPNYNTTTELVFGGLQSLKVNTTNGGARTARLLLGQTVVGKIVTGYMYDFGAGSANSSQKFVLGAPFGGSLESILTEGSAVNYTYMHVEDYGDYGVNFQGSTSIPRTPGWHKIEIAFYPNTTSVMSVDGVVAYSYANTNYSAWDYGVGINANPFVDFRALAVVADCGVGTCYDDNVSTYVDNVTVRTMEAYTWPVLSGAEVFNGTVLLIDDNRTSGAASNMTTWNASLDGSFSQGAGMWVQVMIPFIGVPGFPVSGFVGHAYMDINGVSLGQIAQTFSLQSFNGSKWSTVGANIENAPLGYSNITLSGQVCAYNASSFEAPCYDVQNESFVFHRWALVNVSMFDSDVNGPVLSFCMLVNGTGFECTTNGSLLSMVDVNTGLYVYTVNASGLYTRNASFSAYNGMNYYNPPRVNISSMQEKYLTVQINNTLNGSLVQDFCAQVNGTGIGCTVNGSITWLDPNPLGDARSYNVSSLNATGLYNVSQVFNVSGNATVVLQTRPPLNVTYVNTTKAFYWDVIDANVTVVFSTTSANVPDVYLNYTNGSVYGPYVGGLANVSIPVSGLGPGVFVPTVIVTELVGVVNQTAAGVGPQSALTELQFPGPVIPSGTWQFVSVVNASWVAATGGATNVSYLVEFVAANTTVVGNVTGTSVVFDAGGDVTDALMRVTATDGYLSVISWSALPFNISVEHLVVSVNETHANVPVTNFCASVNGTGIGCTTNGTIDWIDVGAASDSRSYVVEMTNGTNVYDVNQTFNVTGDAAAVVQTRSLLNVTNVSVNKLSYWNGTDATVNATWTDNRGLSAVYAVLIDGTGTGYGAAVPVSAFTSGQHLVTVQVNETVGGVVRTASGSSGYFVVSFLTHNDNVQPSGAAFYNPQVVFSWLPATGNVTPVTYTVMKNLNGTNVTVAVNISATSVAYNVSQETTNGLVYVTAYDNGYAVSTMSNAVPFNMTLEYLTFTMNNSYTGAPVSSFCVSVNSTSIGCTTNGTLVWLDMNAAADARSYAVAQTNALGLYNVTKTVNVTGDAAVVFQSRPVLMITNVTTDKGLYWNKTDTTVTTTVTSNAGPNSVTTVVYDNAAVGLTVPVNGFTVGSHNATATLSEVVDGTNFSTSAVTADFLVTKLAVGIVIEPSGVTLTTRYNQSFNWTPATNGLAAPNYTVKYEVAGVNTTVTAANASTTFIYTFPAQNIVGGVVHLSATDGYVTDSVSGAAFNLTLNAQLYDLACTDVVYPNEDDLPNVPLMEVNFTSYLERSVNTTPTVNMSKSALKYSTTNCTEVTSVGDVKTWACVVPVHYWYAFGNHTAMPFWEGGQNSSSVCGVAQLLASKRTVDSIYFPSAAPGVVNASSNVPVGMRNTGNSPFNLSMKAQNLIGRTVPSTVLNANAFKAGTSLFYAQQMQSNTSVSLGITVANAQDARSDIWVWLSMPNGQLVQEYYTPLPWQAEVNG